MYPAIGFPTASVVKINVPPASAFDQASIGLGFCDSMRSPLSESGRASHDCILSRESTTGRAAWKAALQKPMQGPTLRDFFFFGASSACAEGREGWGTRKHERRTAPLKPKGAAPIESEATADPSLRS